MRIILSNYRYFVSGGPERYLFSIKDLLENNGNIVYPFSVKSQRNVSTQWEDYFLSPIGDGDAVYFQNYRKNIRLFFKLIGRLYYSPEGYFKSKRYAKNVNSDIVYSLHFLNKMSPSIIDGFKAANIPIVSRISDFSLICPQALLTNTGKPCEACIKERSLFPAIKKKCVYGSLIGTSVKVTSMLFHRLFNIISKIDAFVCPTKFTMNKYEEAGFNKKKLHHIQTFIDCSDITPNYTDNSYILYFGRIVEEKGVRILLDAYKRIPSKKPRLLIIGDIGVNDYAKETVKMYEDVAKFINFLPKKSLYKYIEHCCFVVIPSLCYDNLPNVLLEAFAHGKAVIASKHGSFPEIVIEGENGFLFEPGNPEHLKEYLIWAIEHKDKIREMGKNARKNLEENHSPTIHYQRLMEIFEALVNKAK